eukprot:gene19849-23601_t
MAGIAGCKKYETAPVVDSPAYVRVFNNLNNTVDVLHSQQAAPFLTFLMDPVTDASGTPGNAGIVGDYLATRLLFSQSYPANEANGSVAIQTIGYQNRPDPPILYPVNYEYPGNAHVPAAPVINGFDLSAWAQVPSGKHRLMFVVRPQNSIGFKDLSATIRANVLLDTTVNFQKGEVYTLEVLSRDLDNNKYGLYIRQEQFVHQTFDAGKVYVGFTNLSGKTPLSGKYGTGFFFPDKVSINYTYNICNDAASVFVPPINVFYDPLPGYNNTYYSTLNTKMGTDISFLPLPLLSESSFYYQGLLRTYLPVKSFGPGAKSSNLGSMPYFSFTLGNADKPGTGNFVLNSCADPVTLNNYNANTTGVIGYTPNLNLIVNTGQTYHAYGSLNIMEMVYDR